MPKAETTVTLSPEPSEPEAPVVLLPLDAEAPADRAWFTDAIPGAAPSPWKEKGKKLGMG